MTGAPDPLVFLSKTFQCQVNTCWPTPHRGTFRSTGAPPRAAVGVVPVQDRGGVPGPRHHGGQVQGRPAPRGARGPSRRDHRGGVPRRGPGLPPDAQARQEPRHRGGSSWCARGTGTGRRAPGGTPPPRWRAGRGRTRRAGPRRGARGPRPCADCRVTALARASARGRSCRAGASSRQG